MLRSLAIVLVSLSLAGRGDNATDACGPTHTR